VAPGVGRCLNVDACRNRLSDSHLPRPLCSHPRQEPGHEWFTLMEVQMISIHPPASPPRPDNISVDPFTPMMFKETLQLRFNMTESPKDFHHLHRRPEGVSVTITPHYSLADHVQRTLTVCDRASGDSKRLWPLGQDECKFKELGSFATPSPLPSAWLLRRPRAVAG
jgi:hypothetical protein